VGLDCLGVLLLRQDVQEVVVAEEVEAWEAQALLFQVQLEILLDDVEILIVLLEHLEQDWGRTDTDRQGGLGTSTAAGMQSTHQSSQRGDLACDRTLPPSHESVPRTGSLRWW